MSKIPMLEKFAAQSLVDYNGEFHPAYTRKFAELIVRECMNAIYDIDDLGGYHFKAVNAIKQHFGIE